MRSRRLNILLLSFLIIYLPISALTSEPVRSTSLYREGVVLFKSGDLPGAEAKFRESISESPSYTLPYYGLGRIYLITGGKIDNAIRNLKRSVELDRGFARGYFYLGLAELINENYVDALHSFKAAYDLDSAFVESLYNIAVIYDHLGNSYNAFVYYRRYFDEGGR